MLLGRTGRPMNALRQPCNPRGSGWVARIFRELKKVKRIAVAPIETLQSSRIQLGGQDVKGVKGT